MDMVKFIMEWIADNAADDIQYSEFISPREGESEEDVIKEVVDSEVRCICECIEDVAFKHRDEITAMIKDRLRGATP